MTTLNTTCYTIQNGDIEVCKVCKDSGEIKKPISDYIRQLDIKTGHADRPLFNTVFCDCKLGRTKQRNWIDKSYN